MKIKVKLKARDYSDRETKSKVIEAIKKVEDLFPNLELVHVEGLLKNELKLYNLDEDKYVSPLDEEEFIEKLSDELLLFGYMAYPYREKIIIDPSGSRKVETKHEIEEPVIDDLLLEEVLGEEDTYYNYGSLTARKLEIFLERYGRYLRDDTAELVYNRNKSKWGPRFGYKRDDENTPNDALKEEIKQYINDVFYE